MPQTEIEGLQRRERGQGEGPDLALRGWLRARRDRPPIFLRQRAAVRADQGAFVRSQDMATANAELIRVGGQVQKAFNEVYRSFNATQAPFIVADFILPTGACLVILIL